MTLTKLLLAAFATKPRPKARRRLGLEALESRWCPAGGQLDTTFNGTGTRTLPYTTLGQTWDTVIQPDGKIVSVGSSGTGSAQRATVVRMNANGSLDTTFNGTGRLALPQTVAGVTLNNSLSVALQPNGKIVVGLVAGKPSDPYFAAARLNANGTVDTSFGTNAGYWFFNPQPVNSIESVSPGALALLTDGSIILGGKTKAADGGAGFAAVKLTASGQTATAFGSGGMTVVHVGTAANSTNKLAVTPAGGVILSGSATPANAAMQGCLVALTSSGQLDAGFDGDGILLAGTPGGPGTLSNFYGVAMQGNDVIVGGSINSGGTNTRSFVARYTLSGQLDTSFGADGYFLNPTFPSINSVNSWVRVASDGSIVVAITVNYKEANGTTRRGYQVAHLLADGTADTSFGSDGTGIVTVFDTMTGAIGLAIGPDNQILVAGQSTTSSATTVFTRFTGW